MDKQTVAERKFERKRIFDVGVKNSLLTGDHIRRMGDAVWLFLVLVDFVTEEEVIDGERLGKVHGAVPRRDAYFARALGITERTVRRWRQRLVRKGYIKAVRTGYGHKLWVQKSKKWSLDRSDKSGQSDRPRQAGRSPDPVDQSDRTGRSNKTLHLTLQKDKSITAAAAFVFPVWVGKRAMEICEEEYGGSWVDRKASNKQHADNIRAKLFREHGDECRRGAIERRRRGIQDSVSYLDIRPPDFDWGKDPAGAERLRRANLELAELEGLLEKIPVPQEA